MPADTESHRKLAAILSADVVGYSRLMSQDERATLDTLTAYREVMGAHSGDPSYGVPRRYRCSTPTFRMTSMNRGWVRTGSLDRATFR